MAETGPTRPPSPIQPLEFRKKDGTYSKMRSHAGNVPLLPQTKLCPFCPAKFTRTTHLNRHLRNHTNERVHKCDLCEAQFTRSDLLSRHRRGCSNQTANTRRKACVPCTESKVKCDRELPCSKCSTRGKECIYTPAKRVVHRNHHSATGSLAQPTHTQNIPSSVVNGTASTNTNDSSISLTPGESSLASTNERSDSYCGHTSLTDSTETSSQTPINSHLVSIYNHDMFEPFFSDVFSAVDHPSHSSSSAVGSTTPNEISDDYSWGYFGFGQNEVPTRFGSEENDPMSISPSATLQPATNNVKRTSVTSGTLQEQEDNDRRDYLHLFCTAFVEQVPVVHAPSFDPESKPPLLINAMQACGAIFVKSKKATTFISTTLKASRELLSEELSKDSLTVEAQLDLILTVVLLHTLGMFHEDARERATSSIYHGMLITMIRRVKFISRIANWSAIDYNTLSLEEHWRHWAWHEMSKRTLLLSYLQDASQCIFFTMPSLYHLAEITFNLPCDDKLWRARSASDWWAELHRVSPYGSAHERLNCPTLPSLLQLLFEPRITHMKAISHFAHWAVIHGVIGRLFTLCTKSRLPLQNSVGISSEPLDQEFYSIQFTLHNWLQWWMKRPEVTEPDAREEADPPFMQNPLPFYWLGQVALMAYQEGLPPFDALYSVNLNLPDIRFWQVKKWLRHIRSFLAGVHGYAPTILWDELMNIRLQSWQVNLEYPANDDPHGLLGFFVQ